jgi:serine/threonine-protein kinase
MNESLGQYRPLAQLGQGGMARVLLCARHGPANIAKLVVVKEIREELANDAEFVTMFMDEARVATRMNHPNLVQTFDVGAEGQHYFMVMEYLEGQPMHAFLGRVKRKVPLAVHLRVLGRVLTGLAYAHDLLGFDGKPLSIVHRDVSPQNTILCYDGQVKLVDFGIAKAAGAVSRTTAGMFKGKLGYVAPEQVQGTDLDRRADIFSAGVMLWEALVGRRMTYGENEAAVLHKRTTGSQQRVLEARPEADTGLAAICDRAMALDPNDRFATAAEMRDALEARADALGLRATDADIGKVVSDAFVEERRGILAIIERQLASLPARSPTDLSAVAKLPLLASETGPQSIPPDRFSVPPIASGAFTPISAPPTFVGGTSVPIDVPPFRTPKRVIVLAAAGVVALVAIVIAVATLASRGSTATASSAIASASAIATAPTATTPRDQTVDLWIEVSPARAKVTMDGKSLASPFHAAVPKDSAEHRIVVSADGYAPETRPIGLDRDVHLELQLHPLAMNNSSSFHPSVPATASGAATAGSDLQVTKPKHNIDEKDPY